MAETMRGNPRMNCGETSADFCRRMGWAPGQHLVGDEGYGPTVVVLTAIGESRILARVVLDNGKPDPRSFEGSWTLECRDWQPCAPPAPASAEKGEARDA